MTSFQLALLEALFEQQRRLTVGEWSFDSTLYSRASYLLAKNHGKLRRSPAAGRWNTERGFGQRFAKAVARLVKLKLCHWRTIRPPDQPAEFAMGYKRHKSRDRDVFLTEAGLLAAEQRLRELGRMATDRVGCDDVPPPSGSTPVGMSGCDD